MKVLFCAYRDWALDAIVTMERRVGRWKTLDTRTVISHDQLIQSTSTTNWDIIVLIGWSWRVPTNVINDSIVVGVHPSRLPAYAGGSPIQNQIIDGLTETDATLFRLTNDFDAGPIIDSEQFSLEGSLSNVLRALSAATSELLERFLTNFPKFVQRTQDRSLGFVRKRIRPDESKLDLTRMNGMTARQLYDFIRCREDPYPNVFIEDETGKLFFQHVRFEPK